MELGQKTARCESLRALLPYVEWDRFVTLAGSKSGLRATLSYLVDAVICIKLKISFLDDTTKTMHMVFNMLSLNVHTHDAQTS